MVGEQGEGKLIMALIGVPGFAHQGFFAAGSECSDVEGPLAAGDGEFSDEVAEGGDAASVVATMEMIASEAEKDFGCRSCRAAEVFEELCLHEKLAFVLGSHF